MSEIHKNIIRIFLNAFLFCLCRRLISFSMLHWRGWTVQGFTLSSFPRFELFRVTVTDGFVSAIIVINEFFPKYFFLSINFRDSYRIRTLTTIRMTKKTLFSIITMNMDAKLSTLLWKSKWMWYVVSTYFWLYLLIVIIVDGVIRNEMANRIP